MTRGLSWSSLVGQRVGLLGLGVEGSANLRACNARGIEVSVVVDDASTDAIPFDEHALSRLSACDVVIKSPGFSIYDPRVEAIGEHGVTVTTGLSLWMEEVPPSRVIGVTGTKGKSTTTSLIGHILSEAGREVLVAGNIGVCPWDPLVRQSYDYWCVEISSYQAASLSSAPCVVVVTSLAPDHLTWHRSDAERYFQDKLSICTLPGVEAVVANGSNETLRRHGSLLGAPVWVTSETYSVSGEWLEASSLVGSHNQLNMCLAAAVVQSIAPDVTTATITRAFRSFRPLQHRLEVVARIGSVRFVDDGLSTNVMSALMAVASFPTQRVALLVGGEDRGISYFQLGRDLAGRKPGVSIFTMPDNGARIAAEVRASAVNGSPTVVECSGLEDAVALAFDFASPDGVVLLSPAAPSYGRYRDFRDRGDHFRALADALKTRDCESG